MVRPKPFWMDQNCYGHIEGQGISFQAADTKLERFLPKNQHTQRKSLNFENWYNGEGAKIGHYFRKMKLF